MIDSEMESQPTSQITGLATLINRLRMKHLSLLASLGEVRTLHQAAVAINVTQPTATKMLADIEAAFGFPLFFRLPRGMRATPLGATAIAYAQRSQAELMRFAQDIDVRRRGGYGQLVIGAIMGAAPDVLAEAVVALKAARPFLNIRILGETSDQIAELLDREQIELALGRFAGTLNRSEFNFEPLSDETVSVVVRAGHPLVRKRAVSLRDLVSWPWIMQPMASPARQLLEAEFERSAAGSPQNIIECSSIFATLQLLQKSDAVTMISESVVRDYLRAKLLRELPLRLGVDLAGYGLLTRKRSVLSEPANAFVSLLRVHAT